MSRDVEDGTRIRLADEGFDGMFVQVIVEIPVRLTRRPKELLKAFEGAGETETHSPEAHGFFTKAKGLWDDLRE